MNYAKSVTVAFFTLLAVPAVACGGSDSGGGTTTDSSKSDPGTKTGKPSSSSSSSGGGNTSSSGGESTEQNCGGSSLCINGSCKCTEGPPKGKACCNPPESEDDPECPKAQECDTVCHYCE